MSEYNSEQRYHELFPDNASKAKAFDEIAKQYYFCNFGTMQKSDIDVLLFSIYIDQILEKTEENMETYNDYTLSKYLGITQSRISTLKVKKELKYPYSNFNWKKSFERIFGNTRYENGKIKIYIPDKNLYLEVKNAIECAGGYIEVQLNTNLLQVSPEYFIDLLLVVSDDSDRNKMREKLKETLSNNTNIKDIEFLEKQSVRDFLKDNAIDIGVDFVCDILGAYVPVVGSVMGETLKRLIKAMK